MTRGEWGRRLCRADGRVGGDHLAGGYVAFSLDVPADILKPTGENELFVGRLPTAAACAKAVLAEAAGDERIGYGVVAGFQQQYAFRRLSTTLQLSSWRRSQYLEDREQLRSLAR